jgi:hypothetical protein
MDPTTARGKQRGRVPARKISARGGLITLSCLSLRAKAIKDCKSGVDFFDDVPGLQSRCGTNDDSCARDHRVNGFGLTTGGLLPMFDTGLPRAPERQPLDSGNDT